MFGIDGLMVPLSVAAKDDMEEGVVKAFWRGSMARIWFNW